MFCGELMVYTILCVSISKFSYTVCTISYRGDDAHVTDVESCVDEEDVSGDDEAGESGRDDADIGEAEVERRHENLVGEWVQERSKARGLPGDLPGNESV